MAQLVQAVCPGCQARLQIPTEWLHQPIRCKKCGTVMQARMPQSPAAAPAAPAAAVERKPPPLNRQPRAAVPPPLPSEAPLFPRPPSAADSLEPSPFGFDLEEAPAAPTRRRRRKSIGVGTWIGLGVLGTLIVTVAVLAVVFRKPISQVLAAITTGKPVAIQEENSEGEATIEKNRSGGKFSAEEPTYTGHFPRRALIISVHDYLYANPLVEPAGSDHPRPNLSQLKDALHRGLRIPLNQIYHLSDANRKEPRPPLRSIIEASLTNFLKTTRRQDRIIVLFIGHTREIDGKAYLVPLEGELDVAESLLPLDWVYQQLASCAARQKILILDGNRYNAGQGEERPSSGPMTAGFEKALKSPPEGVQVWASCSAEQKSYEFAESALGVFLDSFRLALVPEQGIKGALEGRIQKPNDLIDLNLLNSNVQARMDAKTARRKLKQQTLLAGTAPSSGADFDRSEAQASAPAFPQPAAGDSRIVQAILTEVALPPLKAAETSAESLTAINLPPFPPEALKPFEKDELPADSPLRKAVVEARNLLWALSTARPPKEIESEVQALRGRMKVDLSIMRESYTKPGGGEAENVFKNAVAEDGRSMARIVARLERSLEELQKVGEEIDTAPKRWQANYKLILARLQSQLAYLEDYQALLGQMRREFPPHDPEIHNGWRMASITKVGDTVGRKYDRAARKLYEELAKNFSKTPWEVLAKRERLTAVGLEWQAY